MPPTPHGFPFRLLIQPEIARGYTRNSDASNQVFVLLNMVVVGRNG